jgi:GNAT superfamily N-acetyltransferase
MDEAAEVAALYLRSRAAAFPAIPRGIHADEDAPRWVRELLMASTEVWVADDGGLAGMAALTPTWVEQLYVDPSRWGTGAGSSLLGLAKERSAGTLDLWCFASNDRGRRFYEHHGFVAVDATDGDNEEGEPDVRYRWTAS